MNREELIEKMYKAFTYADTISGKASMAAALDVAVGELLKPADMVENGSPMCGSCAERTTTLILASRRSHYLKPKSDPAVEAVKEIVDEVNRCGGLRYDDYAERIVAAVRKADKSLA